MTQNKPEWEVLFDKEFGYKYSYSKEGEFLNGDSPDTYKDVKQFIRNLIEKTRGNTVRDILDLKATDIVNVEAIKDYAKSKGINLTPEVEGE